jgi:hypothetical protein
LVLLSVTKAVALALEIVAANSVAIKFANEFKLTPLPMLLPELDELLELFGPLVEPSFMSLELPPIFAWRWTETVGGGSIPMVCTSSCAVSYRLVSRDLRSFAGSFSFQQK